MAPGGAQEYLGVTPDLCTIGKAVGGGFPLSAFGGREDIMRRLMPEGDCQHSGTYLLTGIQKLFARHGVVGRVQGLGARFGIYFGLSDEVRTFRQALAHDRAMMLRFVAAAIDEGVYFHDYGGAACHHGFCAAMTAADVDEALSRIDRAFARLAATEA
jgi:glutamate-1-semialdehyde 2,1-aminomutase